MKIGLYISDIFLRTGGTEAYCSYILYALQKKYDNPDITVFSEKYKDKKPEETNIVNHLNSLFGLSIRDTNVKLDLIIAEKTNFIKRALFEYRMKQASKKCDVFFNVSMNLFTFGAKYNIAIIHFPQYRKTKSNFVRKYPVMYFSAWLKDLFYSRKYDLYIANSQFAAGWLEKIWHIEKKKIAIVNPAVNPITRLTNDKYNSIFVCSRIEHSKKIEMLIDAYLSCETIRKTFKLIIAGAIIEETIPYTEKLKSMIHDYSNSIILHENPSRGDIESYYSQAKIFWHAKGYGVDEETDPFNLEHFGITTVEAMSAGCVPVVINKGGQKEIIEDGVNGYRWDTPEQLVEKTVYLMQHEDERKKMSECAIEKAKHYSLDNFTENLGKALRENLGVR